jgi:hypothetical protein
MVLSYSYKHNFKINKYIHTMEPTKINQYKFSIYNKAILEYETDSSESSSDRDTIYSNETQDEDQEYEDQEYEDQEYEDQDQDKNLYIPDNVKFYEKKNFIAYLTPAKRETIDDNDLYYLAASAIYSEYISDKEYVEYNDDNDEFVCFVDNIEQDANEYITDMGMPYRWSHCGPTVLAKWQE